MLKSRNYRLFLKEEDRLVSGDSYEVDDRWLNIKSLPDKMQDEDYNIDYYTQEWSKNSKEKISFLHSNLLIPSTKDCYFPNEKNTNTVSIH